MTDTRKVNYRRLFFALWPSMAERSLLRKQVDSAISGNANIKIAPIENMHCTLAFLGECDDQAVRCYLQAGKSIVSEPFTISFDRIVFRKKQSMLWVSASSMPTMLESLNLNLQAAIIDCGYKLGERKFIPHVTVARKIEQSPVIGEWRPVEWNIDRLVLMRSLIDSDGATYKPLGTWFFGRNR